MEISLSQPSRVISRSTFASTANATRRMRYSSKHAIDLPLSPGIAIKYSRIRLVLQECKVSREVPFPKSACTFRRRTWIVSAFR
eukprot:4877531-Pleurochrysis_carterae.AAC.2